MSSETRSALPSVVAVGLDRARIEWGGLWRAKGQLFAQVALWPIIIVAIASGGGDDIAGTDVSQSTFLIPGFLGVIVVQFGFMRFAQAIAVDRQDGSLLRARSLPRGIPTYLIGRTAVTLLLTVITVGLVIIASAAFVGLDLPSTPGRWFTLVWVTLLGLVATGMVGVAVGALLPNGREAIGFISIPYIALIFVSGIYTPLSKSPEIIQIIGSIFPMRWIAQGLRSSLLPDSAQTAELGGSWGHSEVFLVLAAWSIVGGILAVWLMTRAARRESGSTLEQRRLKEAGKLR